jgi:hypothetical protein
MCSLAADEAARAFLSGRSVEPWLSEEVVGPSTLLSSGSAGKLLAMNLLLDDRRRLCRSRSAPDLSLIFSESFEYLY